MGLLSHAGFKAGIIQISILIIDGISFNKEQD